MALDVNVQISLSNPAGSAGFGYPLLLEAGATKAVSYTVCKSLDEVVAAGFETTTAMYKVASMIFTQDNRPEKIAICAVAGTAAEALPTLASDWRQLVLVNPDMTEYIGVADYIESSPARKMFFVSMSETEWTEAKSSYEGKHYDRTVIFINGTENAHAALVGETAGRLAGSFTYKFKTLNGVVPENLDATKIEGLHNEGVFGYVTKAGDDVTTEGISQSGQYIDITDSIDYVIQNIEYKVQKVLNITPKVPFDDKGIALLESTVKVALQEAWAMGIIATKDDGTTPDFEVYFAPRSATTEADRKDREYKYGSFSFSLAGAIHGCTVIGTITY